jgi:hypothetical protein
MFAWRPRSAAPRATASGLAGAGELRLVREVCVPAVALCPGAHGCVPTVCWSGESGGWWWMVSECGPAFVTLEWIQRPLVTLCGSCTH